MLSKRNGRVCFLDCIRTSFIQHSFFDTKIHYMIPFVKKSGKPIYKINC